MPRLADSTSKNRAGDRPPRGQSRFRAGAGTDSATQWQPGPGQRRGVTYQWQDQSRAGEASGLPSCLYRRSLAGRPAGGSSLPGLNQLPSSYSRGLGVGCPGH